MSIDWVEASKILLTALASAVFTGILAFAAQKWLIERPLMRNIELFKAEIQKARESEAREYNFAVRQLEEFYAPMIGCLRKIRANSDLRVEINKASDIAWRQICEEHPRPFLDHEKYFGPFQKSIEYNNKQLRDEIIPLYDRMLTVFTEKYWLANASTRQWYPELVTFVELWHRWLDSSIPAEVIQEMSHTEERLKPFYLDLESQLSGLHERLSEQHVVA